MYDTYTFNNTYRHIIIQCTSNVYNAVNRNISGRQCCYTTFTIKMSVPLPLYIGPLAPYFIL